MSGTDSRDGWTDRTRCGRTLKNAAWKCFGSSSKGAVVKTEALGLHRVGQVPRPQAWLGTFLLCPPPVPVCTAGRAMLGQGPGQADQGGREHTERGREGVGMGIRPGPSARPGLLGRAQRTWEEERGHSGDWRDSCFS